MTGTTGTAKPKPAGKTAAVTLDDTAKTKLQEVRTHLTAFAASMSARPAPAPRRPPSVPSTDDPSASASASAAAAAKRLGVGDTERGGAVLAERAGSQHPRPRQPVLRRRRRLRPRSPRSRSTPRASSVT